MKILMVSSYLPFPLFSGGQVRLYNLIKELSAKHEITLICEKRDNQTVADIKEVEKICKKVITVNRKKQWTVGNIIKSLSSSSSFLVTGHTHPEMRTKIEEALTGVKFDLIHVETFYVMQNLPPVSIPITLAEHNIEYQVYQKYADSANFFLRPLLMYDIAKIKREEERSWQKATKLIAVSESDAKVMGEKGSKPIIVANGVDANRFSAKRKDQNIKHKKILFIGDFKWIQNKDAARFMIEEIWPRIRSKLSIRQAPSSPAGRQDTKVQSSEFDVKLWIVGRKIPDSIKNLTSDSDVLFDESSSGRSTEELFQEADVLLAPIRVGGGTSYKLLESMSCGTPVVTTELSANAINAIGDINIMVGKTSEELANKTLVLLSDEKLYESIAKSGRSLIEEKYTWKKIARDLENVYKSLI